MTTNDTSKTDTGGGAVVAGNVNTGGGAFAGRDMIVNDFHLDAQALRQMIAILQGAQGRLTGNAPQSGLDALATVLGEISKIYTLIESELVRYLSLTFDPALDIARERQSLLVLEGGQVGARASEARGHCHKILAIYRRDLEAWFRQSLTPADFSNVEAAFERLGSSDDTMVDTLEQLASWLSARATDTLDRIDAGNLPAANQLVRDARKTVLPLRQTMAATMSEMHNLEAELIAASGP